LHHAINAFLDPATGDMPVGVQLGPVAQGLSASRRPAGGTAEHPSLRNPLRVVRRQYGRLLATFDALAISLGGAGDAPLRAGPRLLFPLLRPAVLPALCLSSGARRMAGLPGPAPRGPGLRLASRRGPAPGAGLCRPGAHSWAHASADGSYALG
jgi:hypothetical protein